MKKAAMRYVPSHVDPRQNLAMGPIPLLRGHTWPLLAGNPTTTFHLSFNFSYFDIKV